MGLLFANNASSTLVSTVTASATTVVVQTVDATLFPAFVNSDDYFMLVIEDRTQNPVLREIVKCTARTSATLTVVRGQEGTTALNWAAGVSVSNRLTAGALATLAAGVNVTTQLYLGAFNAAPTKTLENRSLIAGNLYYDTVLNGLQQYNGTAWSPIAAAARSLAFGTYLGSFTTPPITMPNGSALVIGTLYYDSTGGGLRVWGGGSWNASVAAATTPVAQPTVSNAVVSGNQTVLGDVNVTGLGHFKNVLVDNDISTSTLHINNLLVATVGDVSGDASSQNFPSGNKMQWGSGNTTAGGYGTTRVLFPYNYVNPPFVIVSGWSNTVGAVVQLLGAADVAGFSVGKTLNSGGAVSFSWIAIGS